MSTPPKTSSLQSTEASTSSSPSPDEKSWATQVREALNEEVEEESEVPVNIVNVPKTLMATKPDCYVPQQVALGPYHHLQQELYEMERYKIAATKRTKKHLQSENFESLIKQLNDHESRIRACYHKFLDFDGETLALMMVVDASFLLEFLQDYAIREDRSLRRVFPRKSHPLDYARTKSAYNEILRDMVMVENQIPLFVLKQVLEFQFSTPHQADGILCSMLAGFGKYLCPFGMRVERSHIQVEEHAHLVDFLYYLIVPRSREASEIIEVEGENEPQQGEAEGSSGESSSAKGTFEVISKLLSKLTEGPIGRLIKKIIFSGAVKYILEMPHTAVSKMPGFSILKKPVESVLSTHEEENESENADSNSNSNSDSNTTKPPLIEEITIPSVSELSESGVLFLPTNGSISSISFDAKMAKLYLPTISLDPNTEVTLRNLVAYEASTASGPLVIARYTELMNGIIDTKEDAKFLRVRGIILNRLRSDEEVANLWNGMSKSIRLTKVPFLDKVIEDVNKYHGSRWQVKAGKVMKRYVFGSWQLLTLLVIIVILLLMVLQAFCTVYSCSRLFEMAGDQLFFGGFSS
ncbi:hypothetical protein PVL29_011764 [Vitis rotundifolia]|uniref:Uncharacterized protein n=1 Tax=Vitis rotundifolia TaxID=103349 RepID=A0AA39DQW2_VITRO|nr:hypothetical protein PVL29_011764 [Vitis rotundifolia]